MIVAGAVTGWLTAFVLRAERLSRGIGLNVVGGIAGSLIAGLLVAPVLGAGSLAEGTYTISAVLISILGAIVALLVVNLLHSRFIR